MPKTVTIPLFVFTSKFDPLATLKKASPFNSTVRSFSHLDLLYFKVDDAFNKTIDSPGNFTSNFSLVNVSTDVNLEFVIEKKRLNPINIAAATCR